MLKMTIGIQAYIRQSLKSRKLKQDFHSVLIIISVIDIAKNLPCNDNSQKIKHSGILCLVVSL
jgi:hypothetical protein